LDYVYLSNIDNKKEEISAMLINTLVLIEEDSELYEMHLQTDLMMQHNSP
jgi:hypothetical protein